MGIRVTCPSGHQLNLKSFLAGKKGVCPHCGAKFRIPREAPQNAAVGQPQGTVFQALPVSSVGGAAAKAEAQELFDDLELTLDPQRAPVKMAQSTTTPAPKGAVAQPVVAKAISAKGKSPARPRDAIDEAPGASWYVRPPSGGQYGPANGELLRSWIAEGRVVAEAQVWCEGWPTWRPASEVFANLLNRAAPPLDDLSLDDGGPVGSLRTARSRRRPDSKLVAITAGLLIIVGLLAAIFIWLLNR